MFVMALTTTKAFADYGWYSGSMNIGGITTDVTTWSTDGENPTDLGVVLNMTITDIAFNVWSDANDRGGANMYFRIWDGGDSPVGSDQDLWLGASTRITGDHDFSISWTGSEDLASAVGLTLQNGKTYYIDMWAKTYGDAGDEWYSGGGANFHAKLTYMETYTRSVTNGNFGTICLPYGATISGADVYTIESVSGSLSDPTGINLAAVDGNVIVAGKPYIYKATSTTLTASSLTGTYTDAIAAFGMMGTFTDTKAPENSYVIGSDNMIHKVITADAVNVGKYKGYITLDGLSTSAPGINFIPFFDNELSGINTIEASESKTNGYFNLNGQRVAQPTKGLYIVNGKKVVLK